MSQRGKRNYKPRLNDNQEKKNNEPEQQKTKEEVEKVLTTEIEPEVIKEVDFVEEKPEEKPKGKIKKNLSTQPQIVKPEKVQSTKEWVENVVAYFEETNFEETNFEETNFEEVNSEKTGFEETNSEEPVVKEKKPFVKKGVNKNAKNINKDKSKETIKQQSIELDLIEKQKQYAAQVEQMQETKTAESKKAHYVFGRDADGKPGRIHQTEVKEVENSVNPYRSEAIENFIAENIRAVTRMEIEVEIHEELRHQTLDLKKYEALDRKLTTLRTALEDLKTRQKVLNELK